MTADERAPLVKRLRSRDGEDLSRQDEKNAADLIEADGKALALADDAPHTDQCDYWAKAVWKAAQYKPGTCTCWKADYDAAKEALS